MKKRTKAEQLVSAMKRGWVSPMKAAKQFDCYSFNQRAREMWREGQIGMMRRACPGNPRVAEYRIVERRA